MNKFFKWFFSPSKKDESSAFYLAEQIIELKLNDEELSALQKSADSVKELVDIMQKA